jgi:hypothetical protein
VTKTMLISALAQRVCVGCAAAYEDDGIVQIPSPSLEAPEPVASTSVRASSRGRVDDDDSQQRNGESPLPEEDAANASTGPDTKAKPTVLMPKSGSRAPVVSNSDSGFSMILALCLGIAGMTLLVIAGPVQVVRTVCSGLISTAGSVLRRGQGGGDSSNGTGHIRRRVEPVGHDNAAAPAMDNDADDSEDLEKQNSRLAERTPLTKPAVSTSNIDSNKPRSTSGMKLGGRAPIATPSNGLNSKSPSSGGDSLNKAHATGSFSRSSSTPAQRPHSSDSDSNNGDRDDGNARQHRQRSSSNASAEAAATNAPAAKAKPVKLAAVKQPVTDAPAAKAKPVKLAAVKQPVTEKTALTQNADDDDDADGWGEGW